MKIEVGKGNTIESVDIDTEDILAVLEPEQLPEHTNEVQIIEEAMEHPIGTGRLKEIVHADETIAIITSDITRPVPSSRILPVVLEELQQAGVPDENICIYFALGSHRHHTEEEKKRLVGEEIYLRYQCSDSDPSHVTHVGTTKEGTPVDIDTRVVKADRRIAIGNVEFHYFAGFSGGAKAIMPGMSTPEAIRYNHRLMIDPRACAGNLDDNPVRKDLEEACAMVGMDFIVNVVLNTHKEVIYAACGDVTLAHRSACAYLAGIYRSPIPQKADVVIVSQGGAPKDLNLYQMQKALDNAKYAVKDGGTIIIVGSCQEGFGQQTFAEWMMKYHEPQQMIHQLHHSFVLGGHKAAAIALVRQKAKLLLVSDMDEDIIAKTFLTPCRSLSEAFAKVKEKYGAHPSVIVMPHGGSTLPVVEEGREE